MSASTAGLACLCVEEAHRARLSAAKSLTSILTKAPISSPRTVHMAKASIMVVTRSPAPPMLTGTIMIAYSRGGSTANAAAMNAATAARMDDASNAEQLTMMNHTQRTCTCADCKERVATTGHRVQVTSMGQGQGQRQGQRQLAGLRLRKG